MLKMTFTLAVALYAGLVIWGDPGSGLEGAAQAAADDPVMVDDGAATDFARPVIVERGGRNGVAVTRAATAEVVVPEAAVIAASAPRPSDSMRDAAPIGEPTRVSLIDTASGVDVDPGDSGGARMVVTGSRVNLRAGPSTGNAVLDSLPRGTVVEVIGDAPGDWMELRDVNTGQTGYMSANFLAPA